MAPETRNNTTKAHGNSGCFLHDNYCATARNSTGNGKGKPDGVHQNGKYTISPAAGFITGVVLVAAVLFLASAAETAFSQKRMSLAGWEYSVQQMILGQHHNYGGPLNTRGMFLFSTRPMSKEHDLDLVTYGFTPWDDYDWYYGKGNSFRAYAGSFDLGEFLHGVELRNYISASDRITIPLQINRQYDMRSDRMLIWLGMEYAVNAEKSHVVGFRQSLSEQKADLDAKFFYRYGSLQTGGVQVEFTFIDWANNAINNLGSFRGTDYTDSRKYLQLPYLISLKSVTPVWHNLRGELMAGFRTRSRAKVGSVNDVDKNSLDVFSGNYAGVLAEWAIKPVSVGVSWMHLFSEFSRTNFTDHYEEEIDMNTHQYQGILGGYLVLNYGNLSLANQVRYAVGNDRENNIHVVPSPKDPDMRHAPYDYHEKRWTMRSRLGYLPPDRGFTAAIEFSAEYRDFYSDMQHEIDGIKVEAFDYRQVYSITPSNERLTLLLGFRFSPVSRLELGVSYDVDGDKYSGSTGLRTATPRTKFDGGFGRLVICW
jgi:hypothetical protein